MNITAFDFRTDDEGGIFCETLVLSAGPHDVTTRKTNIDIFIAVRTRNLIKNPFVLLSVVS
jgi:hypothetical protein